MNQRMTQIDPACIRNLTNEPLFINDEPARCTVRSAVPTKELHNYVNSNSAVVTTTNDGKITISGLNLTLPDVHNDLKQKYKDNLQSIKELSNQNLAQSKDYIRYLTFIMAMIFIAAFIILLVLSIAYLIGS